MASSQWSVPRKAVLLLAVAAFCRCLAVAQTQKWKPISEDELGSWINTQNDCPADQPPYFWRQDYYDFKGDGSQEAIVVASSCMTGTAGPDIHSVVGRDSNGELVELKIPEADEKAYDKCLETVTQILKRKAVFWFRPSIMTQVAKHRR